MNEKSNKTWSGYFKDSPGSFFQGRKGLLLLAVALLALLLMNLDNFTGSLEEPPPHKPAEASHPLGGAVLEEEIAGRLEKVLTKISGVGRVEVFLTLERGAEYHYASTVDSSRKETREEDSAGGNREIVESSQRSQLVLIRSTQGQEEPVLITEVFPRIKGIVVVAQGARDPRIRESITRAVQTALGIGPHRISVLPMGQ